MAAVWLISPGTGMAIAAIPKDINASASKVGSLFFALKTLLIAFLLAVLRRGPVPRHVAIVMDGNRRFAKKQRLSQLSSGHFEGARTLEKMLYYGFRLGIKTVTVYAFSIENFKRPVEEVNILMALAAERLHALTQNSDLIVRHQVRINVIGAIHLLPRHVQVAAAEAMASTAHFNSFILNICFSYTSSDEVSRACERAVKLMRRSDSMASSTQRLLLDDAQAFSLLLDTWDSPPLDVLVRTSGEARLSEFMLWQVCQPSRACCRSCGQRRIPVQVEIVSVLWPEFGFRQLLPMVLRYQNRQRETRSVCRCDPATNAQLRNLHAFRCEEKAAILRTILDSEKKPQQQ